MIITYCITPSLNVDYIIAKAEILKKPILCMYFCDTNTNFKLSTRFDGSPYISKEKYATMEEFEFVVKIFMLQNSKQQKIFLCGPPGSGKSTVAKKLSKKFGFVNIGIGQILRNITSNHENPMTIMLNEYIHQGKLVPANIMIDIVIINLTQKDCLNNGFILDGYPPSVDDLKNLTKNKIYPSIVFYFECNDEIAIKRQCFRNERITDTEIIARERMKVYHDGIPNYEGILDWYPNTVIVKINAENNEEIVSNIILDTIDNLFNGHNKNFISI